MEWGGVGEEVAVLCEGPSEPLVAASYTDTHASVDKQQQKRTNTAQHNTPIHKPEPAHILRPSMPETVPTRPPKQSLGPRTAPRLKHLPSHPRETAATKPNSPLGIPDDRVPARQAGHPRPLRQSPESAALELELELELELVLVLELVLELELELVLAQEDSHPGVPRLRARRQAGFL
ncbi:hypothetical protein K490DRAFT_56333 [Saccharata proteae CBS 121410]|uniref:Uncharacterized protein n=1 Tax=Saccharata proteae CBS 121410 TaxID=1314787 RepID=A0A9P4HXQ3_9PEZI|nr:hypothetical protein K490DRAFT_56333 [Saccharata proteae CBS 121410]